MILLKMHSCSQIAEFWHVNFLSIYNYCSKYFGLVSASFFRNVQVYGKNQVSIVHAPCESIN